MRLVEKEFLAVLVYGSPFDKRTFFMYFSRQSPGMESLEETRLNAISSTSNQRSGCFV